MTLTLFNEQTTFVLLEYKDARERQGNLLAPIIGAQDGEIIVTGNIITPRKAHWEPAG